MAHQRRSKFISIKIQKFYLRIVHYYNWKCVSILEALLEIIRDSDIEQGLRLRILGDFRRVKLRSEEIRIIQECIIKPGPKSKAVLALLATKGSKVK